MYWEESGSVLGDSTDENEIEDEAQYESDATDIDESNSLFEKSVKMLRVLPNKTFQIGIAPALTPSGGEAEIPELEELAKQRFEEMLDAKDERELSELEMASKLGNGTIPQNVRRIKLKRAGTEIGLRASGDGTTIEQKNARVQTRLPLSIGSNNDLVAETPAGTKTVTVLPEEAVAEMMKLGVNNPFLATGSGEESSRVTDLMVSEKGVLQYNIRSQKEKKLLGLIPVKADVMAEVSAENGTVMSLNEPWYFSYLGFLFR